LPDGFDEVVRIPRQLFRLDDGQGPEKPNRTVKINWAGAELSTARESFFDVRVVRPPTEDHPAPSTNSRPNEAERKRTGSGRPNTRTQIRATVETLWSTKSFRAMGSRIQQAREVRALLRGEEHRADDDMPGYKSSVIQRIIGEVANAQSQKRTD
jgi:hypothetical protein